MGSMIADREPVDASASGMRHWPARRGLGLRLRPQPQMRETLLDHRELQNGRDEIQFTRKPPAASDS